MPSERDIKVKNKNGTDRTALDIKKIVRMRTPGLRHVYYKYLKKKFWTPRQGYFKINNCCRWQSD